MKQYISYDEFIRLFENQANKLLQEKVEKLDTPEQTSEDKAFLLALNKLFQDALASDEQMLDLYDAIKKADVKNVKALNEVHKLTKN